MEVLSFSVEEQNSIFRILSSVLHLGNVYFEKYEVSQTKPRSLGLGSDAVNWVLLHPTASPCPTDRLPGNCHCGECLRDLDCG